MESSKELAFNTNTIECSTEPALYSFHTDAIECSKELVFHADTSECSKELAFHRASFVLIPYRNEEVF
jgi:hypothetical protein